MNADFVELARIFRQVPYYCGSPDCSGPGCLALRAGREFIRNIANSDPETWELIYGDMKNAPVPRHPDERQ